MISTVVELVGFACLIYAGWMVSPVVGVALAGLVLLLIGYLTGKDGA